jgi:urea transporter
MGYDPTLVRTPLASAQRALAAARRAGWFVIHTREGHRQDLSDLPATIASMGSTMFAPISWAGVLFLLGVLVSNWRHAIVAAGGGLVAVALAIHVQVVGGAIMRGYVGFNAVLAALVVYIVAAEDLRLAALGAFVATWIFSYLNRSVPAPTLASGFVPGVWAIMILSWCSTRIQVTHDGATTSDSNDAKAAE